MERKNEAKSRHTSLRTRVDGEKENDGDDL